MGFSLTVRDKDKNKSLTITEGDIGNEYDVERPDGWPYWLERQDGEGQSISEKNLFDILDKWFEENM